MTEAVFFWSSGKDSAAALHAVREKFDIVTLVTTVNRPESKVAVHRVPETLVDAQAAAMALRLVKVVIPALCPNEEYERRLLDTLRPFRKRGIENVVFGDINLADIRAYRDALLARAGMRGLYPLWERETSELAEHEIRSGIRAVVVCVDNNALAEGFVGKDFDRGFVKSLPDTADPCGENGEFHTFVYNAPMFSAPIPYVLTGTRSEGQFSYATIKAAS